MVTIRNADFKIVATSRNLRGLLTYARKSRVTRLDLWQGKTGAQFGVTFADGSSSISDFADYSVLCNWVETRRKLSAGWRACEVHKHTQGVAS